MSLKHMLLGIVKYEPLSGYDLNKYFKHVIHYFWDADQSRIYRALHDMHADGWVQIERVEQQDSPDKKLYSITDTGRAELRRWLVTPTPGQPNRAAWLGQLFFADELETGEIVALLEDRIARMQEELAELERRTAGDEPRTRRIMNPDNPRRQRRGALTLDYGLAINRFQIEWAQRAIRLIRAGDGVADDGETG
jgi:DNA-binding PadR family transcriptional regulator